MKLKLLTENENSFYKAIQENPKDWGPKLQFADWLEERGDPLGKATWLAHQLYEIPKAPNIKRWIDIVNENPELPESSSLDQEMWAGGHISWRTINMDTWLDIYNTAIEQGTSFYNYAQQHQISSLLDEINAVYPHIDIHVLWNILVPPGMVMPHWATTIRDHIKGNILTLLNMATRILHYNAHFHAIVHTYDYDISRFKEQYDEIQSLSKWAGELREKASETTSATTFMGQT